MNNKNFEIENGVLIKYTGNDKAVVMPDSVEIIGDYAFENCKSLISIVIGDNVGEIGIGAFSGCSSLISIIIGDNVNTIGEGAFNSCYNLTSIVIPDCPLFFEFSFNGSYFEDCISLNYNIKDGLKYLGNRKNPYVYLADVENSNITTANIDDNCKIIGNSAFAHCDNLTSIEIPNSVTSIGCEAFYSCGSLSSITVDSSNTAYKSINGVLYSKDGTKLICYPAGKTTTTFTIPNSVTSIGDRAFCNCYNLTSIEIPNSVTSIGNSAFAHCDNLTSIEIPNSVTSIGEKAFYNCFSVTSITYTYKGTKSEWNSISKGHWWAYRWVYSVKATYVTCTDGNVEI